MAIVENMDRAINAADECACKLMGIIKEEVIKYKCPDEPAENHYFLIHTISNLMARSIIVWEQSLGTYADENINRRQLINYLNAVIKDYLNLFNVTNQIKQ